MIEEIRRQRSTLHEVYLLREILDIARVFQHRINLREGSLLLEVVVL